MLKERIRTLEVENESLKANSSSTGESMEQDRGAEEADQQIQQLKVLPLITTLLVRFCIFMYLPT